MLHPVNYARACASIHGDGPLIDHQTEGVHCYIHHQEEKARATDPRETTDWLRLDLVSAMRRQVRFMQTMLREHRAALATTEAMSETVRAYRRFLSTVNDSQPGGVEPTPAVDLVWHTHMMSPVRYAAESRQIAGVFVDHNDD